MNIIQLYCILLRVTPQRPPITVSLSPLPHSFYLWVWVRRMALACRHVLGDMCPCQIVMDPTCAALMFTATSELHFIFNS